MMKQASKTCITSETQLLGNNNDELLNTNMEIYNEMNIEFFLNNENVFNKHALSTATRTITSVSLNHIHQQTKSDTRKSN